MYGILSCAGCDPKGFVAMVALYLAGIAMYLAVLGVCRLTVKNRRR